MLNSGDIRARARATLKGQWTEPVVATLVFFVITIALGLFARIPIIGWIASLVLTGALTLGFYAYFLGLIRQERPNISTLFIGFKQFLETFLLYLLMSIFVFLWSILLIVPGIIAQIRYSQAYFIMRDNPGIGALEAIRRSKELMAGNKGRYFVLCLSFIGWGLLCVVTIGIGILWLYPYIFASFAHFYEDLLQQRNGYNPNAEPPVKPGLNF